MQALVKAMPAWLTQALKWLAVFCLPLVLACCCAYVQSAIYPLPDRRFPVCLLHQVSNLLPVAVLGAGFAVYEFSMRNPGSKRNRSPLPVKMKRGLQQWDLKSVKKISPVWAFFVTATSKL